MLLGVLIALFAAPVLAFFLAVVGSGLVWVLVIRAIRQNRAVRVHEQGLVLVDRRGHRTVSLSSLRAVRYRPSGGYLELESRSGGTERFSLAPGLAAEVLALLRSLEPEASEAQEKAPSTSPA